MSTARHEPARASSRPDGDRLGPGGTDESGGDLSRLLLSIAEGDRTAFGDFYDRTAPRVFGAVCALVAGSEARERITQQAFLRMWSVARSFTPGRDDPVRWAMSITREACRADLAGGLRVADASESAREGWSPSADATSGSSAGDGV